MEKELFLREIKRSNDMIDTIVKDITKNNKIHEQECTCYCNDCFIDDNHPCEKEFIDCEICLTYLFHISTCKINKCENCCKDRRQCANIILDIFLKTDVDYSKYYVQNNEIKKIVKWTQNFSSYNIRYLYINILILQEKIKVKLNANEIYFGFLLERINTRLKIIESIIKQNDPSFIPTITIISKESTEKYLNYLLTKLFNIRQYLMEDWMKETPNLSVNKSILHYFQDCNNEINNNL